MIRPQVKRQKDHAKLLENIKKGDRIITKGGIIGKIVAIKGKNKDISMIECRIRSNCGLRGICDHYGLYVYALVRSFRKNHDGHLFWIIEDI